MRNVSGIFLMGNLINRYGINQCFLDLLPSCNKESSLHPEKIDTILIA